MKTTILSGVVMIFLLAGSTTQQNQESTTPGGASRPVDWFNCDGRVGNLLHPKDCTRFIMCDASGQAWEFDCPACNNDQDRCTEENRLVYNVTVDKCLWTDETECIYGGGVAAGKMLNFYLILVSVLSGSFILC